MRLWCCESDEVLAAIEAREEAIFAAEERRAAAFWQGVVAAKLAEARHWAADGRVDVRDLFRARVLEYERWLLQAGAWPFQ